MEAKFTTVTITDNGKPVTLKSIEADPKDQKMLIITPDHPLQPGDYTVEWHAVYVDTHKTEGQYTFKITE